MTRHDDAIYLLHMLETAHSAVAAIKHRTFAEFVADENLRLAVAHRVQVIGEAARRVSSTTVAAIPLPWTEIIGMRHKIVHDYLGVDFALIWSTVKHDLPELTRVLNTHLGQQE